VRRSKLAALEDAAAFIEDGMRVALGGLAVNQHPMAATREIARAGRRGLVLVGCLNGIEADLLIGAGCVDAIETSYVGLEEFGLAPNFRRAVEEGRVRVAEFSELLQFDRFRASQDGLTFALSNALTGTDILHHTTDVRELVCPFTGRRYHAVRPADPDVVVVHAPFGDEFGNVVVPERRLLPHNLDLVMTRACDRIIVTVERVVSHETVRRSAYLNQIPAFRTSCIVEAPWGAHPCSMQGFYDVDRAHFREYVQAAASAETFAAYLERYVTGPADHYDYLARVGVMASRSASEGDGGP
jgi:glutaconate CoA-transferase subunit A